VTIKFLFFTEFSIDYDMFRRTWPFSGITKYVQSTGEVISNIKFYEKLVSRFLHKGYKYIRVYVIGTSFEGICIPAVLKFCLLLV
jgi:hypothetical protein